VPFPYPKIIDRAIRCHDNTAIEDTARCRFPTAKLSIARVRMSLSPDFSGNGTAVS